MYSWQSQTLLDQVKEITTTILTAPTNEDITLFTLILDNLLVHNHYQIIADFLLLEEVIIQTLVSLSPCVQNANQQITILKRLIEVAFQHCFGVELTTHNNKLPPLTHELEVDKSCQKALDSIGQIDQLTIKELQQLQENMELKFSSVRLNNSGHKCISESKSIYDNSQISEDVNPNELLNVLNVLFELFTQHWAAVTHWEQSQDNILLGHMNISSWHPLHRWLLALYSTLKVGLKKSTEDEKLNHFCCELGKYVDAFVTCTEKDWVTKAFEGSMSDWDCMNTSIEECFDSNG